MKKPVPATDETAYFDEAVGTIATKSHTMLPDLRCQSSDSNNCFDSADVGAGQMIGHQRVLRKDAFIHYQMSHGQTTTSQHGEECGDTNHHYAINGSKTTRYHE